MIELIESHDPTTGSMATRGKPEPQRNDVEPQLLYGRLEYSVDMR